MNRFFFKMRDGASGLADDEAVELANGAAAKAYAIEVAREVMKADEMKKRPWPLEVSDGEGIIVAEVPFAAVDPTLDHLDADLRGFIERLSEQRRQINEALYRCRARLRALRARSVGKPYLIAVNGQRL